MYVSHNSEVDHGGALDANRAGGDCWSAPVHDFWNPSPVRRLMVTVRLMVVGISEYVRCAGRAQARWAFPCETFRGISNAANQPRIAKPPTITSAEKY